MASKTLSLVGMALGAISVLAGTRVLAGIDTPDYVVLPWLVSYNVLAGAAGVFVGVGVWRTRPWSVTATRMLAGAHAATLITLVVLRLLGAPAASESVAAMTFRTVVWLAIALAAGRTSRAVA